MYYRGYSSLLPYVISITVFISFRLFILHFPSVIVEYMVTFHLVDPN